MRRSLKDSGRTRICIPIVGGTMEKALLEIRRANRLADLIELRVDYLRRPDLGVLFRAARKPLIVTNRRREEGGRSREKEENRVGILKEAASRGADFVDVEARTERSLLQDLMKNSKGASIILSLHDFRKTPPLNELRHLFRLMMSWEPEVIKIVTRARTMEDNLTILSLIPYARERGQGIVAFCLGEKGKASRVLAPLLGASWTYASLSTGESSAPGQLRAREMRGILEKLG